MEVYNKMVEVCKALENKKAVDIAVIDVLKSSSITDYFVFATATSNTHCRALGMAVCEDAEKLGFNVFNKEGWQSEWTVIDMGDIIVHIFTKEIREHYNLEKLWSDGKNHKKFDIIKKEIDDLLKKQIKKIDAERISQEKIEKKNEKNAAKVVKKETVKEKIKKEKPVKIKVEKAATLKDEKKVNTKEKNQTVKTKKVNTAKK